MNTSKQVNVMIGLLFLAFLAFGVYIVNEPNRQASAGEGQDDLLAHRGADLFVNNCRTCHGLVGEGGVGPALNLEAYRLFGPNDPEGIPETPEGDVRTVRNFLFNTIACGRTNSAMPVWSERYGGPLSDTQINYIVDMITMGEWEKVEEIGHTHDIETNTNPDEVVFTDASDLQLTIGNCGQYGASALDIKTRDPYAHVEGMGGDGGDGEPGEPQEGLVRGMEPGEFFSVSCSTCHGANREGISGLGLPLTPSALTQPDDFYFDTIKNGRPGTAMPPWGSQLSDEEISTMVEFLKTVEP